MASATGDEPSHHNRCRLANLPTWFWATGYLARRALPQTTGSVVHNYTATSSGFPVPVTFNLAVSYRVNGGPAIPLPAIQRTASLNYPVYEINTIIVAR